MTTSREHIGKGTPYYRNIKVKPSLSSLGDPLLMYRLMEKAILAQTEDQYRFATVYDQEVLFYSFRQDQMTNPQWFEKLNTRVDVSIAALKGKTTRTKPSPVAEDLVKSLRSS
jgi:hypothetical protein